jgi:integrase
MKTAWPKIKKVTKNGKTCFLVDARIDGKGERRFFPTRQEAEGFAHLCKVRRKNEGQAALVDDELASFGWTVAKAVKFALEHLRRNQASLPIEEAIARLIESKRQANNSEKYCRWMEQRLARLAAKYKGRTIASITAPELETFLNGLNVSAGTRNTYRRDLVTLWSWAVKNRFATTNEAQAVDTARVTQAAPEIFTPKQAAALMAQSKGDVAAFHAIGLFAGLRVAEIKRLTWEDVDLAGGYIHVSAQASKTRSRRLVPILPNLADWLAPIAKKEGPVLEKNFQKRQLATRAAAGITKWPENGLRHSFVSYRLAATGNAAQTALEAGHDQAVLFRHYRELVRPADAAAYFSIAPEQAENIIKLAV